MNDKQNKEIEGLIDHLMGHSELEEPSKGFNEDVMAKLNLARENSSLSYKPLISLKTFLFSFSILSLFVFLILSSNLIDGNSWFGSIDKINYPKIDLSFIPQLRVSNLWVYSLLFFAMFFTFQIGSIRHFHKNSI